MRVLILGLEFHGLTTMPCIVERDLCSNVVGKVVDVRLPTDDHFLTFLGDPVLHRYSY